ncbi:hypothetical protein HNY73_012785 [Argiope bruennichi]|uniref:Uncharacterized protein n=2 Tax=Argiope bruennichi TaxID=94029 RepID=A0A8T0F1W0_ARGBR|nr:hypothetical protein HNY73_012785 [Argiope bruennichi]
MKLLKTFSIRYVDVTVSVRRLISNLSQVSYGVLPSTRDYKDKSYCIGYLHRYAACHAALVFDAVSDILDPSSSSDVLSAKLQKKSLNVMFLGAGPGNDFVGFLIALLGHHYHLFDLDVTVVDKISGWEAIFNETLESLKRGDCGKASSIFDEVNVTTTFISADLKDSDEWDENMRTKLATADVVFFVKTLSHIPDDDKLLILQNVVSFMKLDSHLIYIDYPYPYAVFASLRNQLRIVYQAWEMRYLLGHKDNAFGCSNIDSCGAVVKIFERYENGYSDLYF